MWYISFNTGLIKITTSSKPEAVDIRKIDVK